MCLLRETYGDVYLVLAIQLVEGVSFLLTGSVAEVRRSTPCTDGQFVDAVTRPAALT